MNTKNIKKEKISFSAELEKLISDKKYQLIPIYLENNIKELKKINHRKENILIRLLRKHIHGLYESDELWITYPSDILPLLNYLIINKKIDINHVDKEGNTALYYISGINIKNIFNVFLENNANFNIINKNNENILHYYVKKEHIIWNEYKDNINYSLIDSDYNEENEKKIEKFKDTLFNKYRVYSTINTVKEIQSLYIEFRYDIFENIYKKMNHTTRYIEDNNNKFAHMYLIDFNCPQLLYLFDNFDNNNKIDYNKKTTIGINSQLYILNKMILILELYSESFFDIKYYNYKIDIPEINIDINESSISNFIKLLKYYFKNIKNKFEEGTFNNIDYIKFCTYKNKIIKNINDFILNEIKEIINNLIDEIHKEFHNIIYDIDKNNNNTLKFNNNTREFNKIDDNIEIENLENLKNYDYKSYFNNNSDFENSLTIKNYKNIEHFNNNSIKYNKIDKIKKKIYTYLFINNNIDSKELFKKIDNINIDELENLKNYDYKSYFNSNSDFDKSLTIKNYEYIDKFNDSIDKNKFNKINKIKDKIKKKIYTYLFINNNIDSKELFKKIFNTMFDKMKEEYKFDDLDTEKLYKDYEIHFIQIIKLYYFNLYLRDSLYCCEYLFGKYVNF